MFQNKWNSLFGIAVLLYLFKDTFTGAGSSSGVSATTMRNALLNWSSYNTTDSYSTRARVEQIFATAPSSEVVTMYNYLILKTGWNAAIAALSSKYNLFT